MNEKELDKCVNTIKTALSYKDVKFIEMKNEKVYFEGIDFSNQQHSIILNTLSGRYFEQINDMLLSYNYFAYTK